ncbi:MAG: ATP synthase F0 subunit B [Patescibacteria group bacterium]
MTEALHVFGINGKLLLTQAVNFGIVLVVLTFVLYKPLIRTLEERRMRIKKGVEDARAAEAARLNAEEEGRRVMADVARKAEGALADAHAKAGKEEERIVREAHAEEERIMRDAKERAAEEKRKILSEGKEEIARMIVLGAERIVKEHEAR